MEGEQQKTKKTFESKLINLTSTGNREALDQLFWITVVLEDDYSYSRYMSDRLVAE